MGIKLVNIGMRFGAVEALSEINVSIPEQGIVAFIGPNGAGKSTLLDILSGFLVNTTGSMVDDQTQRNLTRGDLAKRFARLHQRVVVPEDISVDQFLRFAESPDSGNWLSCASGRAARDNVAISPRLIRVLPFLEKAGLRVGDEAIIQSLSYGQKRAVALAATLLAPKKDLLLDEPLAGLSTDVQEVVKELISTESQSRLVVLCEHDLDSVMKIADRFFILVGGKIVGNYLPGQLSMGDLVSYFRGI